MEHREHVVAKLSTGGWEYANSFPDECGALLWAQVASIHGATTVVHRDFLGGSIVAEFRDGHQRGGCDL